MRLSGLTFDKEVILSKRCVLVIGHKKEKPGAVNESAGVTEFAFNELLSSLLLAYVKKTKVTKVYRGSYSKLPEEINKLDPDFIVSLHCNAFNKKASGTEVLYYHSSEKGKQFAGILQKYLLSALGLKDRGIKPKEAEDRGGYLLRYTSAPCLISEPFFIDNDSDYITAADALDGLAKAYANAIDEISESLMESVDT